MERHETNPSMYVYLQGGLFIVALSNLPECQQTHDLQTDSVAQGELAKTFSSAATEFVF